MGSIPGSGRSPIEGHVNPLWYPCLENSMDSIVHGILQARIRSGLPFPPLGDLPDPGIEPTSLASHALAGRFFTTVPPEKPGFHCFSF